MTHIATTLAPMHPPAVHSSPFSNMFVRNELFNSDLSKWNVAAVTKMKNMFHTAKEFNSDLSKWNVNKVTTMRYVGGAAVLFFLRVPLSSCHGAHYAPSPWLIVLPRVLMCTHTSSP